MKKKIKVVELDEESVIDEEAKVPPVIDEEAKVPPVIDEEAKAPPNLADDEIAMTALEGDARRLRTIGYLPAEIASRLAMSLDEVQGLLKRRRKNGRTLYDVTSAKHVSKAVRLLLEIERRALKEAEEGPCEGRLQALTTARATIATRLRFMQEMRLIVPKQDTLFDPRDTNVRAVENYINRLSDDKRLAALDLFASALVHERLPKLREPESLNEDETSETH